MAKILESVEKPRNKIAGLSAVAGNGGVAGKKVVAKVFEDGGHMFMGRRVVAHILADEPRPLSPINRAQSVGPFWGAELERACALCTWALAEDVVSQSSSVAPLRNTKTTNPIVLAVGGGDGLGVCLFIGLSICLSD